jgi:hypothetical protein
LMLPTIWPFARTLASDTRCNNAIMTETGPKAQFCRLTRANLRLPTCTT